MIGMGIDASTSAIGWSIWNDDKLLDYGKILPTERGLEWRDRIINHLPQLQDIINEHKPQIAYVEDVPLMPKGGKKTLVQLGAVQGSLLGLFVANNIQFNIISVGQWRKNIGLHNGTEEGKNRDNLKIASIDKANEVFGLNLQKVFTKNGTFKDTISDDDIADSIWIYASNFDKYKVKRKTFGKGDK